MGRLARDLYLHANTSTWDPVGLEVLGVLCVFNAYRFLLLLWRENPIHSVLDCDNRDCLLIPS
jgi:hypothetical protein